MPPADAGMMADRLGVDIGQGFFEKLRTYEDAALRILDKKKSKTGNIGCAERRSARYAHEFGEFLGWACENCPSHLAEDEGGDEKDDTDE